MQKFSILAFLVGLATLATVAAVRLSVDALALIIGFVLGVVVMAPVVVLMAWMARSHAARSEQYPPATPPMPPVIVVQPGAYPDPGHAQQARMPQQQGLLPPPFSQSLSPSIPERQWELRVFGEEETAASADLSDWLP